MTFEVGDVVEWCGVRGIVSELDEGVKVIFPNKLPLYFCSDGKYEHWHKEPSLKLIEKAKKKVNKSVTRWVNIDRDTFCKIYDSPELADECQNTGRIACVPVKIEWEE